MVTNGDIKLKESSGRAQTARVAVHMAPIIMTDYDGQNQKFSPPVKALFIIIILTAVRLHASVPFIYKGSS